MLANANRDMFNSSLVLTKTYNPENCTNLCGQNANCDTGHSASTGAGDREDIAKLIFALGCPIKCLCTSYGTTISASTKKLV